MKRKMNFCRTTALAVVIMVTLISCGSGLGKVSIDGNPMLGNTLTANTASLKGSGAITYQWTRNNSIVDGRVDSTYVLGKDDENSVISVTVFRADNTGHVTSKPVYTYGSISPTYKRGDTGPGGGIIFYYDENGFTMTDTGETAYYLEAAPTNQATEIPWGGLAVEGTKKEIGTGRANTAAILARAPDKPDIFQPAKACVDYRDGGKDDWFLPSQDELMWMYLFNFNMNNPLGISTSLWSSTQGVYAVDAWAYSFSSKGMLILPKSVYTNVGVRAIRAF